MSNIELSWLLSGSIVDEDSLISESVSMSGSSSDELSERIIYKVIYLRNNGPNSISGNPVDPKAYALSFYTSPYSDGSGEYYGLHKTHEWAALEDENSKPYGLFTVFGYNEDGTESHIDNFIDDSITKEQLSIFQHNWVQGSNMSNGIKLSSAYTYQNGVYAKESDLSSFSSAFPILDSGETSGVIKVLFGVRIPEGAPASRILVNHNVYYEESI